MAFVQLKDVCKDYRTDEIHVRAADHISFEIEKGELAMIVGPSGAGKTTVLNLLGGMDQCDSGEIVIDGYRIDGLNQRELTRYRREDIGFVFQFYNLVQNLTAIENIELASDIIKNAASPLEMLRKVGLEDRASHFPAQLSGGEQQRVSIARALAKNPKLLLCDEPTGALDYQTGKSVLQLLQDCCRTDGMTVIIITHNRALTPMADKVIELRGGQVSEITVQAEPVPVSEIIW
ncbi:MAG: ABC transporter ATP-binding protein [Oscillospiraceae bacterium]|nr:ABC transporter ATP-binding protein [Oscillospiraceae bacterium]